MPYSVSMPITRRTLIAHTVVPDGERTRGRAHPYRAMSLRGGRPERQPSQVLASVGHGVDRPACLAPALPLDQVPHCGDPLTLVTRDPCPVLAVGGVALS